MKKFFAGLTLAVVMMSSSFAQVAGNPGTGSQYFLGMNDTTGRFELCWADKHQHGNCMDLEAVYELIEQGKSSWAQKELESSI